MSFFAFKLNGNVVRNMLMTRMLLPAGMGLLLLLALAYWWLGNVAHEVFGSLAFVLLAFHLATNRFWFKSLFRGTYDTRRALVLLVHLALICNMFVLLVTSVVVSQTIFAFLPFPEELYLSDVHWFSAYWVMAIVGVHIGSHWYRVMTMARSLLKGYALGPKGVAVARGAAAGLALLGIWSSWVLGVWGKLSFNYSLDFWDFTSSVAPFFGHWATVICLPAVATHYLLAFTRRRRQRRPLDSARSSI